MDWNTLTTILDAASQATSNGNSPWYIGASVFLAACAAGLHAYATRKPKPPTIELPAVPPASKDKN